MRAQPQTHARTHGQNYLCVKEEGYDEEDDDDDEYRSDGEYRALLFLKTPTISAGTTACDSLGARTGMANHHNFYFTGANERPQKPRIHGMTEVRLYSSLLPPQNLQDVLETMGQYMDGLKCSGCSFSLMPHDIVRQLINLAHAHDVYVSMGGWADHVLTKGPSIFKQLCK